MENNTKNIISDAALQEMSYRELSVLEDDVLKLIERVQEQKQKMSVVEIQRLTEVIQNTIEQIVEMGGRREDVIEELMNAVETKPVEVQTPTPTSDAEEDSPMLIEGDPVDESNTPHMGRGGLPLMKDLIEGIGVNQLIQIGNNDVTEKNENPQWGRIYSTEGLCPTLMHTGKTKVVRRNDGAVNPNKVRIECPEEKKDKSVYTMLGASNHCDHKREPNDFYATEPKAVELLCELEKFNHNILEPCCGKGHISEVLKKNGYNVTSRDLIDRGYGEVADFLDDSVQSWNGDIVTNPPYTNAQEFVEKSLDIIPKGNKVAMFLKHQFWEGKKRKEFLQKNPPKVVYVSSSRLKCGIGGDFDRIKSSAISYAWFVWEKGYTGDTATKLFN